MLFHKKNIREKITTKTNFVLVFSSIFLFFLGFILLSNTETSVSSHDNLKKESTVYKTFSLINSAINSEFSLEDFDLDNPCFIPDKTFIYLQQIDSFDNRSQILKDHQIKIQFHLPLFLRYHAIKIL